MLDFMEEEKMLDPFLQWLGWFTDKGEKEIEEDSKEISMMDLEEQDLGRNISPVMTIDRRRRRDSI